MADIYVCSHDKSGQCEQCDKLYPPPPSRITELEDACRKALNMLTGSEREYAVVDYPKRPNYTICDLLREVLKDPPQDRSDW